MRALIIANPRAGKRGAYAGLEPAIEVLERAGWEIEVEPSASEGDTTRLAREAVAAGFEAVLVAGGDGTINEAVQALAGTDTALGYLPYGTVNIWARELHIPLHPNGAARAIVEGEVREIDLGLANDRYFLLMAGIGFDSEVVRRARRLEHHKRRFGILPYVAAGITTAPLYWGSDMELRFDSVIRRVHALMLVAGNTRLYGGRFYLTPNAVANDGLLDICIVKGHSPLALVRQSLPLLLSGKITHSDVEVLKVRELTVQTDEPLALQADGELIGSTPVRFGVAPRALKAIVPRGLATDLIA